MVNYKGSHDVDNTTVQPVFATINDLDSYIHSCWHWPGILSIHQTLHCNVRELVFIPSLLVNSSISEVSQKSLFDIKPYHVRFQFSDGTVMQYVDSCVAFDQAEHERLYHPLWHSYVTPTAWQTFPESPAYFCWPLGVGGGMRRILTWKPTWRCGE